jgi:hypothetical protein
MPFLIIISRKDNEDVAVLLPPALFRFSSLLLRIENPYTQWVWIANPDQRHGTEHLLGREVYSTDTTCTRLVIWTSLPYS